ncbi:hypothetical protein ElyMa_002515800, partial [Elysia marginata]
MDDISLNVSQRKAVEAAVGEYVYDFLLAALSDIYDDYSDPAKFPFSAEKGYDVFDNFKTDVPPEQMKRPIVIMRDAKSMLGALFACIVSAVNDAGGVPSAGGSAIKSHFANARAARTDQVLFMINTTEALWTKIHSGFLDYNFNSVETFCAQIRNLVSKRTDVDPGADELARIFVRFLKCVVSFTASFAIESKVTFNEKHLRGVFRCFGTLPGVKFNESLSEFFDCQLAWIGEQRIEAAKLAMSGSSAEAASLQTTGPTGAFCNKGRPA